jgi:type I restriction enzyme S subunit
MTRERNVAVTDRCVSDEGIAARGLRIGQPGTVLFAMYASVGATAVLRVPAVWNQAILGITPMLERSEARFVRYWLDYLRPQLDRWFRSNTQDNLNAEVVANLPFPLASTAEQRAVADFLDAETTRIDALITAKRRMMAAPRVPRARLGYRATLQSGLTVDGARDAGSDAVTRPYLRVANVQSGWLDLSTITEVTVPRAMAARCRLRDGDVLMTEGGDLDKLGRGTVWRCPVPECLHQNHVFAVRPRVGELDADYLALYTRTTFARVYFESTGVKTTNLASTNSSKIMALPIPALDLDAQRNVVAQWDDYSRISSAVRRALANQLDLLAERRQALVTAAVTGELEVPVVAA